MNEKQKIFRVVVNPDGKLVSFETRYTPPDCAAMSEEPDVTGRKTNELEDLVPPLELCKQIPEGAFKDSALVWCVCEDMRGVISQVEIRALCDNACECFPAPTLAEIMEELRKTRHFPVVYFDAYKFEEWTVEDMGPGGVTYDKSNPATASLKLWMEINGAER